MFRGGGAEEEPESVKTLLDSKPTALTTYLQTVLREEKLISVVLVNQCSLGSLFASRMTSVA